MWPLVLAGCGAEPPAAARCEPASTMTCFCPDGSRSVQACGADGHSYGACACAGVGPGGGLAGQGSSGNGALGGAGAQAASDAGLAADGGGADTMTDGGSVVPPGQPGSIVSEPSDEAAYIFDQQQLRSYNLVIAPNDLATINGNPAAEQYVQGMVEVDGTSYGPVGIRYKGSAGAFLSPCTAATVPGTPGGPKTGKCSLKVAFDFVDPEGRFHGVKKLNFHSMSNDPSLLRERLGYAMFRESGIAAPRAAHARVSINGAFEGLFALVEQVDGRFTRARFSESGKGNLYKEVWPIHDDAQIYLDALETNRDESPSAARMLAFKAAIAQSAEATAAWLDRDYMLRYLAVDRVIINDDGVFHWWCFASGQGNNVNGLGNHNYYWYEAQLADRLWLIPWDLDFSFVGSTNIVHIAADWRQSGVCTCAFQSLPPSCDPLTQRWIEWSADYEKAVDAFVAGPFAAANVDAKLAAWIAQIQPVAMEASGLHGAPTTAAWQDAVTQLKSRVTAARTDRGYHY